METLETVISMHALREIQEQLQTKIDPRNWTKESRDKDLDDIRQLSMQIAADSTEVTQQILNQEVHGKSFLFWNLRMQVLGSFIDFLEQAVRDYNWLSEEEKAELSFDQAWLSTQILNTIPFYTEAKDNVQLILESVKTSSMIDAEEI